MSGIISRMCAKMADRAKENMKYKNLRNALRVIRDESRKGRKSVNLNTFSVITEGQDYKGAESSLLGYVAASLRTLGFKTTVVHTLYESRNELKVEWDD